MAAEAGKELTIPPQAEGKHYAAMQSAPRFPLHLPVEVNSPSGACSAETQNISANGVLFAMDRDVQIDCHGRVVRSFEDQGRRGVGVVIDEYRFERA